MEHGLIHIQAGNHDHDGRNGQADTGVAEVRGEPASTDGGAPGGGEKTGEQGADEGAGFGGNARIDDFEAQRVGDHADGCGDEAHALRRVEHDGEAPDSDEGEQHTQQAVHDGVQSEWLEAFRIQVHDGGDHPACERGHEDNAQHVADALNA